ncbi:aminotransferase class IV [Adhaeribacter soli]|uniref:branched-chain-amino-acid transaminase n=1 Tax=Adhaeribacter soli TaxID=2607655 RepID=A0A5N1IHU9_9BACT|nr:aminotransferase class IV [Adhaeribacter soli]KAA9325212.1 aminotransferase class IV [Adhaeribacter soli]
MKYILYNFELIPESKLQIQLSNRAFQYNDGAFETMLFINGKVRFLEDHLARLQKAAKVLQIELPEILFQPETVALWVEKLIQENQLQGRIRLKLKIWRSGTGLYTPEENTAEVLISAAPQIQTPAIIEKADFAESVRTHFSSYSFFKGPNSLQYVLAGCEKQQRNLEEIILLSSEGYVSECLASNIFWIWNETVFTPEIRTGCVAGVMRENLLRVFQAESLAFQEGFYLTEELLQAETVFTSNAAGIKILQQIGTTEFSKELPDWLNLKLKENQFI